MYTSFSGEIIRLRIIFLHLYRLLKARTEICNQICPTISRQVCDLNYIQHTHFLMFSNRFRLTCKLFSLFQATRDPPGIPEPVLTTLSACHSVASPPSCSRDLNVKRKTFLSFLPQISFLRSLWLQPSE